MFRRLSHDHRQAMSLSELLLALGVAAMIAALLIPAFHQVRQRSQSAQCLAQLKQWGSIIHIYTAEHRIYPATITEGSSPLPWYTTATSNIQNRTDIYCPQRKNGQKEYFSYNIYLGWVRSNVSPSTRPYRKVSPLMVKEPSATLMLTDGSSNADKQSDGTGTYILRKIRNSYNHDKHQGGANWLFCDGHGEWMTKERALELGGPTGDAYPFVRPFP